VYQKLLGVGEGWFLAPELAEAGRTHLIRSLTDWPIKALNLDKYIDIMPNQKIPSLSGGDPVILSTRALFENMRDMLIDQLSFMDAAVEYAMVSFYDLLDKTRQELRGPQTNAMEPYLALIPTLHATMFRNLLLPFWEAMQKAVKSALGQALGPVLKELGADGFLGDVFEVVDTAQAVADRAKEAIDLISGPGGVGTHNLGSVAALGRDLDETDKDAAFGNQGGAVGVANPFGGRESKVTAGDVTQAHRDTVKPDLKWDPDAAVNEKGPDTEPPPPPPPGQGTSGGSP
jgi:hypothetical protein